MNKNLTELVFILDKSGSMAGLEEDTIGGFNAMLRKQKELEGDCHISTILFNHTHELLHDRLDIKAVAELSGEQYRVGGATALIDALGFGLDKLINVQAQTAPAYRATQVLFVIITDGYENSSGNYTSEQVKAMVEKQTAEGWEFIYLGANIDAVETARAYGITPDRAQNFHADKQGIHTITEAVSAAATQYRQSAAMPKGWNKKIKDDFEGRAK